MLAVPKKKPKPPPTIFGQRLKSLRVASGMSQQQLAEGVGTNRVSIARFETSPDANPTLDLVHKICQALGCTPNDLIPLSE